jgi:hypothetical protein
MPSQFDDLLARYLEGRLVVFAGSGVSHAGGLPSWSGLIERLIASARESGGDAQALAEADAAMLHGDMIRALGIVQATMTAAAYGRVVARSLDDSGHPVPPLARAIADLAPTLHAVVTTNLDRFLERALAGDWPCFNLPKLDLGQQRHYILQLHGTRTDRDSWVLSERDYENLLHAGPGLRRFVEGLFCFHSLLFVGYGLRDPDFDGLCGYLRVLSRSQAPQHFALVPDGTIGPYERRRLAEAGIELIAYDNADGSHANLLRLLGGLSSAQRGVGAGISHPSSTGETAVVASYEDRSRSLTIHPAASSPRTWYSAPSLLVGLVAASTVATITAYIASSRVFTAPSHAAIEAPAAKVVAGVSPEIRPPAPSANVPVDPEKGPATTGVPASTRAPPGWCPKTREQELILWLGQRPSGVDRSHRLDLSLTFDAAGDVRAHASPEDSPLWPAARRRLTEFAASRSLRSCRMNTTWDP